MTIADTVRVAQGIGGHLDEDFAAAEPGDPCYGWTIEPEHGGGDALNFTVLDQAGDVVCVIAVAGIR